MSETPENRRPLKTRGAGWAQALASALGRAGASPNLISATSIAFAFAGAGFLLASGVSEGWFRAVCFIAAATCVQLRLLANMLDGMVAVEHGRGSPTGPIWNELPDRIADALFLVAAGYGASEAGPDVGLWLGWLAALLAMLTAYVRELGRGLGFTADFAGPMAKPHRMFALTVTCIVSAFEPLWGWFGESLAIGLAVIALGAAWTVVRRTRTLARRLRERGLKEQA